VKTTLRQPRIMLPPYTCGWTADLVQFGVPIVVDDSDVGTVVQQHLDALRTSVTVRRRRVVERRQTAIVFIVRRCAKIQQRLTERNTSQQPLID